MINILGISSSPRNSATDYAIKKSLEEVEKIQGIKTELILLRERELNHCVHCDACIKNNSRFCLLYEENNADIYEKFFEADGYIIGSPVYSMTINAQLTSFFNLLRPAWNIMKKDPAFFWDKVGAAIAVGGTRHGGQELTINAIHGFYHTHGIIVVGGGEAYNGGTIWSKDRKKKGAKEDVEGIKTAKIIGQRLGLSAYMIQNGQKKYKELLKQKKLDFITL